MGEVKEMLSECTLKDRERHNSRLFIDLCENIHIHFREYRIVFSLPEYFEFVKIVADSTNDVRNYLRQNPEYKEQEYRDTIFIAGGRKRQRKFLANSPEPNRSAYFNNSLRVELQKETVTDEIHIHYRDFRLALNRENFKDFARCVSESMVKLEDIEVRSCYARKEHSDRRIDGWEQSDLAGYDTRIRGVVQVPVGKVRSYWYSDLLTNWSPNAAFIDSIKKEIENGGRICPVVLTRAQDGCHFLIDGHHRMRAVLELGGGTVPAVVTDLTWEESRPLREVEAILKAFDADNGGRYWMGPFFREYLALSLNTHYRQHYWRLLRLPGRLSKFYGALKARIKSLPLPSAVRNTLIQIARRYSL